LRKMVAGEKFQHVTIADLSALFQKHKIPESPQKRLELGFPAIGKAPICPSCGVVHARVCQHHEPFVDRMIRTRNFGILAIYRWMELKDGEKDE